MCLDKDTSLTVIDCVVECLLDLIWQFIQQAFKMLLQIPPWLHHSSDHAPRGFTVPTASGYSRCSDMVTVVSAERRIGRCIIDTITSNLNWEGVEMLTVMPLPLEGQLLGSVMV